MKPRTGKRRYVGRSGVRMPYARWLMQKHLGRELRKDEIVHHKDGNILNDDIENLEVISEYDHVTTHMNLNKYDKSNNRRICDDPNKHWCSRCKQFLDKKKFREVTNRWNGLFAYCKVCEKEYWYEKRREGKIK